MEFHGLRPTVIAISEHWLNDEQIKFSAPDDYTLASHFCRKSLKHGGTVLFCRRPTAYHPLDWISSLSSEQDCELCGIHLPAIDVHFVVIYRSPLGDFDVFLDIMDNLLNRLFYLDTRVKLVGDFNLCLMKQTTQCRRFLNLISSYGYSALIDTPTRGQSCIDNFLVNFHGPFSSHVLENVFTDHKVIVSDVNIPEIASNDKIKWVRPLYDSALHSLSLHIGDTDWSFIVSPVLSIEDRWETLTALLVGAADEFLPWRAKAAPGEGKAKRNDWFTKELAHMRKNLSDLIRANIHANRSTKSWEEIRAIKRAKINANDKIINNSSNPYRAMWSLVNRKRRSSSPSWGADSGSISAQSFLDYFSSVPHRIANRLGPCMGDPLDFHVTNLGQTVFDFEPVYEEEMMKIILSLNSSGSSDVYGLNSKIVKHIAPA
ncbi:Hypothetical protein NTJ_00164 [Nesidiocoris tenuis]|uniref:Endonuclease/exonuclease/phosphatase domain-containing protein n=1 Tax=Nesidiocoris tenuis TaxID=355587 RepID=A0ABN7A8A7_9HEMI|nr:Hypothetical protein NTJ_00164 [Nesidiocoris tenuis]